MNIAYSRRILLMAGAAIILTSTPAIGEELGSIAKTYPIKEPDMIELIQARLKKLEVEGKLKEIEDHAKERVTQSVKNPPRVIDIITAKQSRSYLFDPSVVTTEPILDGKSNVLIPVGTRVNPLQHIGMSSDLIFFDGDDPKQIVWAEHYMQQHPSAKPILVGGSLFDSMKKMNRWLYFDQMGYLTGRLGITAVPAAVKQEGERLRVDEIALN